MEIPYDLATRGTIYRVDAFNVDGGARDDVALVVFDADDQPLARQVFQGDDLEALMPRELDRTELTPDWSELTPADWLRDVVDTALNNDGRDVCDDCGNRRRTDRPNGGHAVDCEAI